MHVPKPALSRRSFLKGATAGGLAIRIGLPALDAMFNVSGTAYAATDAPTDAPTEIEKRFVLWFNGNGISEKYWIPAQTGANYSLTPCLSPLATLRDDVHVITGLDSPAARLPGPGNSHYPSMSALLTGQVYTGRGAGGASFDQILAQQIGGDSRFRSLEIGVSQECFGEAIQRNMSWADRDRPLPPETLPHRLFDRLFGEKEGGWVERQKSVLDAVSEDAERLNKRLGSTDRQRLEDYLSSVRDLERSITSLPPAYREVVERPAEGGDLRDWPRIAKLQSDLLVHAFASRQTRVASYMLTKCQGLARFPWLGHTAERHHEYTHGQVETPRGARILRDINRWHVEEFAYLVAKLKSTPEGEGTLLDNTCAVFVHEHAEANAHKNNGLAAIVAGHVGGLKTGTHTRLTGSMGDLYVTVAQEALGAGKLEFPTAEKKLSDIV